MLALTAFLAGLVIGPWLGILVDRIVPRAGFAAEHRCVACGTGLGRWSLVPVASWFRPCLRCGRSQRWRYPATDLVTAALFAAVTVRFGSDSRLMLYLAVSAVLVVLSVVDIETHLLPNRIVWPAIWASLFGVLVVSGAQGDAEAINSALVGAAVAGGFIGASHLVYQDGMGRGDVKLSLLLGLFVGWLTTDPLSAVRLVLYALLVAMLVGAVGGTLYNLVARRGRAEIPFGPALALGAMVVVLGTGAGAGQ